MILRCSTAALFCALGLLLVAPAAAAHGGNWIPPPPLQGPPDTVPPGMRPPQTPGSQPPVITPPINPRPTTTPGQTKVPTPIPTLRARGTRTGARAVDPNASWETWWTLHRLHYLPDRREAFARNAITPRENEDEQWWTKHRATTAARQIVPFLRALADPTRAARDDVRASALLALGKSTHEAEDVERILAWAFDARAPQLVRESAALAVGLLRRQEASLRLDGALLDRIRGRLLDLFDEEAAPDRTRAFAALSLGLLADQPYGDRWSKDGRLVVRGLWQRLARLYATRDLPVALFVALGLQPRAGVPDAVREGLRGMALGKRRGGRRWDAVERGYATATLIRIAGPGTAAFLERLLVQKRLPKEVRRATFLSFSAFVGDLDASERPAVAAALEKSLRLARDPLTKGLGHLAAGHLLAADHRGGKVEVLQSTGLGRHLLQAGRSGPQPSRGFSLIALALAAQTSVTPSQSVVSGGKASVAEAKASLAFQTEARDVIVRTLERERDPDLRSAASVAAGLGGAEAAKDTLIEAVGDRDLEPGLRGHAAVALGQLGIDDATCLKQLHLALAERRFPEVRRQAALALALLGGRTALTPLLRELQKAKTERVLAQVVVALGRLGDLRAVAPLEARARDDGLSEPARALAVVALGLIGDPEPRPSLLRLTFGAFYVARSPALHEAFTIL